MLVCILLPHGERRSEQRERDFRVPVIVSWVLLLVVVAQREQDANTYYLVVASRLTYMSSQCNVAVIFEKTPFSEIRSLTVFAH